MPHRDGLSLRISRKRRTRPRGSARTGSGCVRRCTSPTSAYERSGPVGECCTTRACTRRGHLTHCALGLPFSVSQVPSALDAIARKVTLKAGLGGVTPVRQPAWYPRCLEPTRQLRQGRSRCSVTAMSPPCLRGRSCSRCSAPGSASPCSPERRSQRRLKAAGFPRQKYLKDFDFEANPNIEPALIAALAKGDWVRKGQPLCLIGDSGTGKSHLLIALGTEAASPAEPAGPLCPGRQARQ